MNEYELTYFSNNTNEEFRQTYDLDNIEHFFDFLNDYFVYLSFQLNKSKYYKNYNSSQKVIKCTPIIFYKEYIECNLQERDIINFSEKNNINIQRQTIIYKKLRVESYNESFLRDLVNNLLNNLYNSLEALEPQIEFLKDLNFNLKIFEETDINDLGIYKQNFTQIDIYNYCQYIFINEFLEIFLKLSVDYLNKENRERFVDKDGTFKIVYDAYYKAFFKNENIYYSVLNDKLKRIVKDFQEGSFKNNELKFYDKIFKNLDKQKKFFECLKFLKFLDKNNKLIKNINFKSVCSYLFEYNNQFLIFNSGLKKIDFIKFLNELFFSTDENIMINVKKGGKLTPPTKNGKIIEEIESFFK